MIGDREFLNQAIELARENIESGGRPFGAVVVRDGDLLSTGVNEILRTNDPTSHAELNAIRAASQKLGSPRLDRCIVYASGQPCPMCMAAMRMSGVQDVVYALSNEDAEPYGLSTASVYQEFARPLAEWTMKARHVPVETGSSASLYRDWQQQTSSRT